MSKTFNKRNITVLKLLAVLGLAAYITSKAIPKLEDNPSTILLSASIIGCIGFSIALFKLGKEIKEEHLKEKSKEH